MMLSFIYFILVLSVTVYVNVNMLHYDNILTNSARFNNNKTNISPCNKTRKYTNVGVYFKKSYSLTIYRNEMKLKYSDLRQPVTHLFKRKVTMSAASKDKVYNLGLHEVDKYGNRKSKSKIIPRLYIDKGSMFNSTPSGRTKRQVFPSDSSLSECNRKFTCAYNGDKTIQNCYCDGQCSEFHDCCDDFTELTAATNNLSFAMVMGKLSCRLNIIRDHLRNKRGYWMVTRCPFGYHDNHVVQRCMSLSKYDIPVTDVNGITYSNAFCATCNKITTYRPWKVLFELHANCVSNLTDFYSDISLSYLLAMKALQNRNCKVSYEPPSQTNPRVCFSERFIIKSQICTVPFIPIMFPMTVMFTMSKAVVNGNDRCLGEQKFDNNTGLCLDKNCHEMNIWECGLTGKVMVANHQTHIKFDLVSSYKLTEADAREALALFILCLPLQHYGIEINMAKNDPDLPMYLFFYASDLPLFETQMTAIYSLIRINLLVFVTRVLRFDKISLFDSLINDLDWSYIRESSNISFEIWREKSIPESDIKMNTNSLMKDFQVFKKSDVENVKEKYMFNVLETGEHRFPKLCNVSLGTSEPTEIKTNTRQMLEISCNFHDDNFSLVSTINFELNLTETNSNKRNEFIPALLTYISLTLSSASIPITVFVQRYIGTVNTVPGHISENVMFVMFLFNICYMLGIGMDNLFLCLILSVMTHYFVLSCFIWISIFVLHSLKTLQKVKKFLRRPNRNRRKFPKFPLVFYFIGYVAPLAIVLPSVIIDQCDCTSIQIGYTDSVCFPTGFPSSLFIFVGPVIVFVLCNMSCLIYIACKLFHWNKYVSNQGISNSRSFVGVYIRLCLLSGLSWGLGVLSEWLHIDILRYIFIVLTGSHGFIFCVCILSTQIVREGVRKKFSSGLIQNDIEMNIAVNNI